VLEEDKQFLRCQRQKGRQGCMSGPDHSWARKQVRLWVRKTKQQKQSAREKLMLEIDTEQLKFSDSDDSGEEMQSEEYIPPGKKNKEKKCHYSRNDWHSG